MGESVELILDGIICQGCGVFLDGDEVGYPRLCECCEEDGQVIMDELNQSEIKKS